MSITRFDVPEEIKEMFEAGIKIDLLDVKDIYALSSEFGNDWVKLVDEICEYAYVRIHSDGGESHRIIVEIAERYWKEINI